MSRELRWSEMATIYQQSIQSFAWLQDSSRGACNWVHKTLCPTNIPYPGRCFKCTKIWQQLANLSWPTNLCAVRSFGPHFRLLQRTGTLAVPTVIEMMPHNNGRVYFRNKKRKSRWRSKIFRPKKQHGFLLYMARQNMLMRRLMGSVAPRLATP